MRYIGKVLRIFHGSLQRQANSPIQFVMIEVEMRSMQKKLWIGSILTIILLVGCTPPTSQTPTVTQTPLPTESPAVPTASIESSPPIVTGSLLSPELFAEDVDLYQGEISRDGTRLLTFGSELISVWDIDTMTEVNQIETSIIRSGESFSPDNRYAAINSVFGFSIWDLEKGEQWIWVPSDLLIDDVEWSPDGQYIAYPSGDNINVWDVSLREVVYQFVGRAPFAFTPDSSALVLHTGDCNLDMRNLETGETIRTFCAHGGTIEEIAISPMTSILAVTLDIRSDTEQHTIKLFDINDGSEVGRFDMFVPTDFERFDQIDWSPNGQLLAAVDHLGQLSIWTPGINKPLLVFQLEQSYVNLIGFGPGGQTLYVGNHGDILRYNLAVYPELEPYLPAEQLAVANQPIDIGDQGEQLYSVSVSNVEIDRTQPPTRSYVGPLPFGAIAQLGMSPINRQVVSPNGAYLAASTTNGVALYDVLTFEQQWYSLIGIRMEEISWSPNNALIAVATDDPHNAAVYLIDVATGRVINTLGPNDSLVLNMTWSASGETLVLGTDDFNVSAWNVETGTLIFSQPTPQEYPRQRWRNDVQFNANGTLIANHGDYSGTVTIRSHDTGEIITELGINRGIFDFAWSPIDPDLMVLLGYDVILYDIRQDQIIEQTKSFRIDDSARIAWSPDGQYIVMEDYLSQLVAIRHVSDFGNPFVVLDTGDAHFSGDLVLLNNPYSGRLSLNTLSVWQLANRQELFEIHGIEFLHLLIEENAFVGSDEITGQRGVYSLMDGTLVRVLSGNPLRSRTQLFSSIEWSSDGTKLLVSSRFADYVWDVRDKKILSQAFGTIEDLHASDWLDLDTIILSSDEEGLLYWDPITDSQTPLDVISDEDFQVVKLAVSPTGKAMIIQGRYSILLYNIEESEEVLRIYGVGTDAAWSPDGSMFAVNFNGLISVWDATMQEVILQSGQNLDRSTEREALALAWSSDSQHLAFSHDNYEISILDIATGEIVQHIQLSCELSSQAPISTMTWSSDWLAVAFGTFPDAVFGSRYAKGAAASPILIIEPFTGNISQVYEGHTYEVMDLAFDPSGDMLASTGFDGVVYIWNVRN